MLKIPTEIELRNSVFCLIVEFTGYSEPKFYSKPPPVIKVTEGKLVNLYCAAIGK